MTMVDLKDKMKVPQMRQLIEEQSYMMEPST